MVNGFIFTKCHPDLGDSCDLEGCNKILTDEADRQNWKRWHGKDGSSVYVFCCEAHLFDFVRIETAREIC